MPDENTVQLGYQELEDHNLLMQLIRKQIDRMDDLQMQYETCWLSIRLTRASPLTAPA